MFCSTGEVVFIHSEKVDKTCPSALIFVSSQGTSGYIRGYIKSTYPELALSSSKNLCARTDIVFFPISQVCARGATLIMINQCMYCWILSLLIGMLSADRSGKYHTYISVLLSVKRICRCCSDRHLGQHSHPSVSSVILDSPRAEQRRAYNSPLHWDKFTKILAVAQWQ